ncbi:MAG: glycosyltransferase family 4 protein [Chitinophagaceae bacterium]|nr:glycosyltransferase family 4 protein [Chitinophagaceae bacterium]
MPELKKFNIQSHLFIVTSYNSKEKLNYYFQQLELNKISYTVYYRRSKFDFIKIAREISQYLRSHEIKVIHSHLFNADLIAVIIKRFFYKDLIIFSTKHGYQEKEIVSVMVDKKKIRKDLYYRISKILSRNIDYSASVSGPLSEFYQKTRLSKEKMKVIHNGSPEIKFSKAESSISGNPKILTVGRLVEIKGLTYLFKVIPTVIKSFNNVQFIFVGNGPMRHELEEIAAELKFSNHVKFVGFSDPSNYLATCDLMVIPSLFESFGLVYIEALSAKLPLIAFDTGGIKDIVDNGINGILVPLKNHEMLGRAIIDLLESPSTRKRIAEMGYKKYTEEFTVSKMALNTYDWYQSILGCQKPEITKPGSLLS